MTTPRPTSLVLGLGSAVMAISSAALVILLADPLPPMSIAAGRVAVTGVALAVLGIGSLRPALGVVRRPQMAGRVGVAGLLLAIHFAAWIASLGLTSVPRSMTLVSAQPLFAGLLSRWLGDRVPWTLYGGAVVAVLGTLLMVADEGGLGAGGANLGDGLALLAGAAAAGYLAVGRSVREQVSLRPYLAAVHLVAAAMLVLAVWLMGVDPCPPTVAPADLLAVVYLGLVPGLVGHGLLNWAVRRLPVHVVALVVLFEPLGATALTVVVLHHTVGLLEGVGA
ncbi:MAG: DMT family transporter, partial [Deltaproteobacteria bacterium]|nr:DMT family transporter [Deltaproteobacteria bacterium]